MLPAPRLFKAFTTTLSRLIPKNSPHTPPMQAPDRPSQSGTMTPGAIASELSKLDLPAPTHLHLNTKNLPPPKNDPFSPQSADTTDTGDISGPEPEAIVQARHKARSESMSEQLSEKFSNMKFPQPERIFGPNEGGSQSAQEHNGGRAGVSAEDWDKIKLADEVPEAVKEPTRMTHSRHGSRVEPSTPKEPTIKETPEPSAAGAKEQKITPFDVEAGVDAEGKLLAIDYDKITKRFGANIIQQDLLERFERLTGQKPHPLMRRGTFYSHRDFNLILDRYEKGQPFYLYTGRGPSSDSMHMGHLVPFMFTAYLQRVFNVPLVIQVTDDEKYLLERDAKKQADLMKKNKIKKPIDLLRHYKKMGQENIRDIIACGVIPEKTFIFSDLNNVSGTFYENVVLISKTITLSQSKNVFGFADSDNVGMYHFAAVQATPSFCNSFPQIFGTRDDIPALIPCAIDQDPYFLLTRDSADRLGYKKPALLHSKFLPALQGAGTKMSASKDHTAIFMTDDAKKIAKKIKSHAFSGGGASKEIHERDGGNPDVDIAYQYLTYFEEDDAKMERLANEYRAGTLSTSQMKEACIEKLQEVVAEFQKNRALVTDEVLQYFQDPTRKIDPRPKARDAAAADSAAPAATSVPGAPSA
ncbi:tryptophan-tRNA ligase [Cryptococcus amylolentus CBS 6039]|uniref:Tryptophan--tRNA ligase, cytoplasmic n=2 Tax=Cryptococcus amylolentus TaxID=104669 RepID=A0A1E3I108_9TREE|nr:tryptophan-tRNA ligase [Cryptococcus amylolentus CBS 6039]ODN82282.1 tryptophan-tRNA ligase [Cryptococcus amylolentus CBS 6039]ODO09645.1 tryptophan-tRNA ligase [Cryptococcus amylolentus CBS 6273]